MRNRVLGNTLCLVAFITAVLIVIPAGIGNPCGPVDIIDVTTDKYYYDVGETVKITLHGSFETMSITDLNFISFMIKDQDGSYVWEQLTLSYLCLWAIGHWQGPQVFEWDQTYRLYESHYGSIACNPPDLPDIVPPSGEQVPSVKYYVYGTLNGVAISESVEIMIGGVQADVEVKPETLNLKSRGVLTAFVELPENHDVEEIDMDSLECQKADAVKAKVANNRLVLKFHREDLEDLEVGDEVILTVKGTLKDGTPFIGSDTIEVI